MSLQGWFFKISRTLGLLAILLYMVDRTLASLDGYVPGDDYPIYTEVPKGLSFTCQDKIPGYYADPETQCQVWHWCVPSIGGNVMYSFICTPGTVFNQRTRVCDWFFKVDCPNAQSYYGINDDLYKDADGNYIIGKNTWSIDGRVKRKIKRTNRQGQVADPDDATGQTPKPKRRNFICQKKYCKSAFIGLMMRHKKEKKEEKKEDEPKEN